MECKLIRSWYPDLTQTMADKIIKFANLVRVAYNKDEVSLSFSPRPLEAIARLTLIHKNPARAVSSVYFRKLADDGEKAAVNAMFKTIFGNQYGDLS